MKKNTKMKIKTSFDILKESQEKIKAEYFEMYKDFLIGAISSKIDVKIMQECCNLAEEWTIEAAEADIMASNWDGEWR